MMWTYLDSFHNEAYDIRPLDLEKRVRVYEGQLLETIEERDEEWAWKWYFLQGIKLWERVGKTQKNSM